MLTIVGYCEKSDPPITKLGSPDSVSVVCLMHDTYHEQQQTSKSHCHMLPCCQCIFLPRLTYQEMGKTGNPLEPSPPF